MRKLKIAYASQKCAAKKRKVEFLLSFEEWLHIWRSSGRLEQKGRHSAEYCMARFGDKGPYAVWNVRIITQLENHQEQDHGKGLKRSLATRQKMSAAALGKIVSSATRENMRLARLGKKHALETRQKIAKSHLGIRPNEETKLKISLIKRGLLPSKREMRA